jgi:hypothetical protein
LEGTLLSPVKRRTSIFYATPEEADEEADLFNSSCSVYASPTKKCAFKNTSSLKKSKNNWENSSRLSTRTTNFDTSFYSSAQNDSVIVSPKVGVDAYPRDVIIKSPTKKVYPVERKLKEID